MSSHSILPWTLALLLACSPSRDADPDAPSPPLRVADVTIDALSAPRDDNPLVAGEEVRLGVRIRGGAAPLTLRFETVRIGAPDGPPALDVTHALPEATAALELAVATRVHEAALTGVYQLRATVTDAHGVTAHAVSGDVQIIGSDAETVEAPAAPPFVALTDVAGRRRRSFVRGERVTVHALLPGHDTARLSLRDPQGALLAASEQRLTGGALRLPIDVPRLAGVGAHEVHVQAGDVEVRAALVVAGLPFAPVNELILDDLTLRGGQDLRAPRAGVLTRGELLAVTLRVGGQRAQATGTLRLYTRAGEQVAEAALGRAALAHPGPRARAYIEGTWRVPTHLAPGRYQLQAEVIEDEHVSTRYREVLVQ